MQDGIIGHEKIVRHMSGAVSVGKISHAYLFEGEKGSGKRFLADYFAKLMLCEHPVKEMGPDGKERLAPCGKCLTCRKVADGNHPDLIHVTHEKPNVLAVGEVREQVVNSVALFPYEAELKIYVIPDADLMNEAAQNAILKTIEEPPSYVVILLLAENANRLLPTIRSRCLTLPVRPIDEKLITEYLIGELKIPDYLARMAAAFSAGNIGRAIRFASSSEFEEMKDTVIGILKHLDTGEDSDVVEQTRTLATYKNEIRECIDLMLLWFKDLLVVKATGDMNRIVYQENYPALQQQAAHRTYNAIEEAVQAMEEAKAQLRANVNFDNVIELMLMQMRKE